MDRTFARRLTVLNMYGICARPAALFVKTTCRFEADVTVSKDDNSVSGKSIMGLMTLEASQGSTLTVTAKGPDAKEVVEALTDLMNVGFYESEGCRPIPEEHSEWLVFEPPPPILPPIRCLLVAFAMGAEAVQEREYIVRTALPLLRKGCRPKHMRIRGLDLCKGRGLISLHDFAPPRPFFVILRNHEARRLQTLDVVPEAIADLRGFITRNADDCPLSHEAINTLVRCYPWINDSGKYVLRSGVSDEEAALLAMVFHRRHDYLRKHCLILFHSQREDLSDLRNHLASHGWKCEDYADDESFRKIISDVLERWLENEGAAGS
jgi:phosphocarrier protein